MMLENGGIFVCKCRHLVMAGGSRAGPGAGSGAGAGNKGAMPGFMSPRIASPMHPSQVREISLSSARKRKNID